MVCRHLAVALLCASDLCVTAQYRNGFRAHWLNDPDASEAEIELCEVKPVFPEYDELAHWSFASVTNNTGNVVNIENTFSANWPGLIGEVVRISARTNGAVQVGVSTKRGCIRIPDVPDSTAALIVRACVRRYESGHYMTIESIGDVGEAIVSNKVSVTEEMQDYVVGVTDAVEIAISPSAKASPLQVADIRLVASYEPMFLATNSIGLVNAGLSRRWTFRSLPPGDYVWRVVSHFEDREELSYSQFCPVTLSPDDPLTPRGFVISIR